MPMLVATDDTQTPVGIVVCEWKIDGEVRHFIIFPFQIDDRFFVDVEVPGSVKVISPAMHNWISTKVGFGDNSTGYPMDEQTIKDLYHVWDNGSKVAPEASMRLYNAFAMIIDHYKNDATQYPDDQYAQAVNNARENGWDVELIKLERQTFPYHYQA